MALVYERLLEPIDRLYSDAANQTGKPEASVLEEDLIHVAIQSGRWDRVLLGQ
jgi:hypothetical protein